MPDKIQCGNGVTLERGLRCTLSDGTTLVSDHYYPSGEGPWPTLLMRQPYGRDIASTVVYAHPIWFARQGYHVVIQDVRGRGDSEGDFYPFRHEARDGAETIAWLLQHPACNGRIGMYGFSYQGATQLLAAAENPQGLVCIAPHMTATDLYHGWFYHQGALRLSSSLGWGIQMLREDSRRRGLRDASDRLEAAWSNLRAQTNVVPYSNHPAIIDPALPSYVRDWFAHPSPNHPYWDELSTDVQRIQVPALHISGWYDTYLDGSIAGYLALRKSAATEFARDNQYLLAGPWVHIPWAPADNFDTDVHLVRWFNHWLKGTEDFQHEPRIRHFALVENKWHDAAEWPSANPLTLYLHSPGNGTGTLSPDAPTTEEPRDIFVYDPEVPVMDQPPSEHGNNRLVYTTPEFKIRAHLFGQPSVTLYAATSAPNADLTARLLRVSLSGKTEFICIGIARASWLFRETKYKVDTIQTWHFTLEPTSLVLSPGESLRLEIASSAFPLYDRNPSTDLPASQADHWNWRRSTQQIAHSPEHPSAIQLPIEGPSPW
jgi:putative CocE/NonD family hydrolase